MLRGNAKRSESHYKAKITGMFFITAAAMYDIICLLSKEGPSLESQDDQAAGEGSEDNTSEI